MEEFKDDNQNQEQDVELVTISKESNQDYDPDDDFESSRFPLLPNGGRRLFSYEILGALLTVLIFGINLESVPVNHSSFDDDGGTNIIYFFLGLFICKMDLL